MHAVAKYVYGDPTTPLAFQPPRKNIVGLGVSDTAIYADVLAEKFSYTNTYFHQHPFLDICDLKSISNYRDADFLICSEVLEHTKEPPGVVLRKLSQMLRVGGRLILSAPTVHMPETIEWYAGAASINLTKTANGFHVEWTTLRGSTHQDKNPCMHGGDGATLEMRVISHERLVEAGRRCGFEVETLEFAPQHGYVWSPSTVDEHIPYPLDARVIVMTLR